jgi:hypothetical protein
MNILKAVV